LREAPGGGGERTRPRRPSNGRYSLADFTVTVPRMPRFSWIVQMYW
jgi:hypothetical protein